MLISSIFSSFPELIPSPSIGCLISPSSSFGLSSSFCFFSSSSSSEPSLATLLDSLCVVSGFSSTGFICSSTGLIASSSGLACSSVPVFFL
jgi:hypothetical protein